MMQAIAHHYPRVEVEYAFINRSNTIFPAGFDQRLRKAVDAMRELSLTAEEESFLRERCYYFKPNYVDMLRGYRYDPKQVEIRQVGGELFVSIRGPWYLTVLWEVPLMAMISELYFEMMDQPPVLPAAEGDGTTWQSRLNYKLRRMSDAGCIVSDFGSRRRHSFEVHDHVVKTLAGVKCCAGTSNVHLAHKYNLTPIGTMAHEFIMGHAAMYGYRRATAESLKAWVAVYEGELGIALPDTYTTPVFLRDFNTLYAKLFDGTRWDSGGWQWFTDLMIAHWKSLRIDPATKVIVYSDGLTDDVAIDIQKYAAGKVVPRYGIGTFLTNSVGREPLNMVIKLTKCAGHDTVKLSDSPGKVLGKPESVSHCKYALNLQ
jgi:nicotinate phosphoribosyltransferase